MIWCNLTEHTCVYIRYTIDGFCGLTTCSRLLLPDIDKTEQIVEIMDLLGSILKSMDKPPSVNDKQKALMKRQLSPNLKIRNLQKENERFRQKL